MLLNTENTEKKQEGYTEEEKGASKEDDIEYIVGSLGIVPPTDDDHIIPHELNKHFGPKKSCI